MNRVSGDRFLNYSTPQNPSVAYVAQTSWLLNATVRDNILMGSKYDADRYAAVIEACALTRDLQTLEGGDMTEIGEKYVLRYFTNV